MAFIKSNPLLMIQENKQVSAVKLAMCVQYKTSGAHTYVGTGNTKALVIEIYGIDKTGSSNLIAKCPIETTSAYSSNGFAADVVIGVPVKEYPYIYWQYDNSLCPDLARINSQPTLFVDVRDYPDMLDTTTFTNAILI